VATVQKAFGNDWHKFVKLFPEWTKDLQSKNATELEALLGEDFGDSASSYSKVVCDFLKAKSAHAADSATPMLEQFKNAGIAAREQVAGYDNLWYGEDDQQRPVVIKLVDADDRELKNALFIAKNKVPNTVPSRVHKVGDQCALIMPRFDKTLDRAKEQHNKESVERGVSETADALARIHELGFVHMDVKAENIFIAEDGKRLLGDFGTRVGDAPTSCTERLVPQGIEIVAEPNLDDEMLLTTAALLLEQCRDDGESALGYRPAKEARDAVFAHVKIRRSNDRSQQRQR
jgi:hypothetical protein